MKKQFLGKERTPCIVKKAEKFSGLNTHTSRWMADRNKCVASGKRETDREKEKMEEQKEFDKM